MKTMKNKIQYWSRISLLNILLLCMCSCGDSFLNITPVTADNLEDYFQNEEQIYKALVAAYDPLQWTDYYGGYNQLWFMSDLRSDDVFVGGDLGSYTFHHEMQRFLMEPIDSPRSLWECLYTGVSRCNTVIEKMPNVKDISDTNRERYLAEAHFLRAYYYHWLWKFWGNIPYYTAILEPPYMVAQIPADSVYMRIMADVDYACGKTTDGNDRLMNGRPAETEWGRVTVWAALMLKARVILYQNDEARLEEVYNDMTRIKNSALFMLTRDYALIWDNEHEFVTEPDMMNKSESIWEINHTSQGGSWSWPQGGEGTIFPKFIGINGLENDPDYQAGWGFEPVRKEVYQLFEDGDQRRDASIINFEARKQLLQDSLGVTITYTPRAEDTGLFNAKYAPRKGYNEISYDPELNFNNNVRVFRYSECLLNLSEVAVRKGWLKAAQTNLDLVRTRAFNQEEYGKTSSHYVTVSLDAVLQERRLEFVCEGMRFWDLVRTGHTELLTETNENWSRTWNNNWKYLPIPSLEIDRTDGQYKLKQNPGY